MFIKNLPVGFFHYSVKKVFKTLLEESPGTQQAICRLDFVKSLVVMMRRYLNQQRKEKQGEMKTRQQMVWTDGFNIVGNDYRH